MKQMERKGIHLTTLSFIFPLPQTMPLAATVKMAPGSSIQLASSEARCFQSSYQGNDLSSLRFVVPGSLEKFLCRLLLLLQENVAPGIALFGAVHVTSTCNQFLSNLGLVLRQDRRRKRRRLKIGRELQEICFWDSENLCRSFSSFLKIIDWDNQLDYYCLMKILELNLS
ncbi:hypothetical protein CEXT_456071 [Caerostris extrusa]|uniref:Uncharacterized protein n=1 Tax=Caerostris extrusa TaxID=172846 RepID=A0AAV4YDB4_CAEEX|nr:hypothetical protein CEXT_456071 [Caerostris extrusa]